MTRRDDRRTVLRLALFARLTVAMNATLGAAQTDETPGKVQELYQWTRDVVYVYVDPPLKEYFGRAPDVTKEPLRWEVTQLPPIHSHTTMKFFIDNGGPGKDVRAYYQFLWHDQQGVQVLVAIASRYVITEEENQHKNGDRKNVSHELPAQRPRNGRMYGLEN